MSVPAVLKATLRFVYKPFFLFICNLELVEAHRTLPFLFFKKTFRIANQRYAVQQRGVLKALLDHHTFPNHYQSLLSQRRSRSYPKKGFDSDTVFVYNNLFNNLIKQFYVASKKLAGVHREQAGFILYHDYVPLGCKHTAVYLCTFLQFKRHRHAAYRREPVDALQVIYFRIYQVSAKAV